MLMAVGIYNGKDIKNGWPGDRLRPVKAQMAPSYGLNK